MTRKPGLGGLLLLGAAAFGAYKYSKMSEQDKKNLKDKGKKMFDDNFVIRHLTVFESKGKEHFENPGALDMLTKYKGEKMGIPFWLVFDDDGKLLADAKIRSAGAGPEAEGDNCGCPATKEEVAYFIEVLKKTTSLNERELEIISARFSKNN